MTFNPHMKISSKHILLVGFVLIITMMIASHIFAISKIQNHSKHINESVSLANSKSNRLHNIFDAAYESSKFLTEMTYTKNTESLDNLFIKYKNAVSKFKTNHTELSKQNNDEKLSSLLNIQSSLLEKLLPIQNKVHQHVIDNNIENANHLFHDVAMPIQEEIYVNLNLMFKHHSASIEANDNILKSENYSALIAIIIFDIISIIFSIFLTSYILRKQKLNDTQLTQLATTDTLTNLPNRSSFIKSVEQRIETYPDTPFTIAFLDIDYFKAINDNYGHEYGDEVIKLFASTIQNLMSEDDIICRLGGDEFVLLIAGDTSKEKAMQSIQKLSDSLDTSFNINNKDVFITASIGACLYKLNGDNAKSILKNADIAMYSAKESGRNGFQFFSNRTKLLIEKEHALSHALNTIIKNNNKDSQLFLKYQPLQNISDDSITECEALIRWTTRQGDNIPPDEFIQIAEKTNLIEKVNKFVIEQACSQQKQWQDMGIKNVRIHINLSGSKHSFHNLLSVFKSTIEALELSPAMFGIELTERTILDVCEQTVDDLQECRDAGMKISIDDFGTGYSSLSYLKKLPITTIKIDKSFIAGLPDDHDDQELVKTIITLGHSLNLDVVAEGVETAAQLEFLRDCSCDIAQGYYFHYPLDKDEFSHMALVA